MKFSNFLIVTLLFGGVSSWSSTNAFSNVVSSRSIYNQHQSMDVVSPLHAYNNNNEDKKCYSPSRREILSSAVVVVSSVVCCPSTTIAQAATSPPLPLQTSSGLVRVEGIGGGLDLLTPQPLSSSDVFYPSSMIDTKWKVQRVVTSVEGDLGQAALSWQLLGGRSELAFTSKLTEVYDASFVAAPNTMDDANYEYDGKILHAAILDRRYELSSRTGIATDAIQWDAKGSSIRYTRNNNDAVNLTVVRRKIEPPSEEGFGSDEIYRIDSSAGGIFSGTNLYRAARVRKRFRRGFDESSGKRILDAIEVVTTHRVLDGIAGIELPTSTCKSRLRYTQL